MRIRTIAVIAVLVAGAAGAGVLVLANARHSDASTTDEPTAAAAALKYATVEQRDIRRTTTLNGTVNYGTPTPLPLAGGGTLTGLPAVGATIAPGQVLAEVDGRPVVLLTGSRPAWRDLSP